MKRWIISFLISCIILSLCFIPKISTKLDDEKNLENHKTVVKIKNKKKLEEPKILEEKKVLPQKKSTTKKSDLQKKIVEEKSIDMDGADFFYDESSAENLDQENLLGEILDGTENIIPKENQCDESDAEKINEYKKYVLAKIEGKKNYPLSSRAKGETGRVKIKINIDKNGGLCGCEILQECESSKLNEATLTAVKKSVPFKNLPNDLESLEIIFTMDFSLD